MAGDGLSVPELVRNLPPSGSRLRPVSASRAETGRFVDRHEDDDVSTAFEPEIVAKIASAYEATLTLLMDAGAGHVPHRDIRMRVMTLMIAEATQGFADVDHLKGAALFDLARSDERS